MTCDDSFRINNIMSTNNIFYKIFKIKYNNNFCYIKEKEDNYEKINVIGDYFTEEPRIKSIGYGETLSPYEYWKTNYKEIIQKLQENKTKLTTYNLREVIYSKITEARQGKPSVYKTLYEFFKAKKVLDPASAWVVID